MTFKEAMPKFLHYKKITKTKGTYDYYRSHAKTIMPFFNEIHVEDLTVDMCLSFIEYQRERNPALKNNTINKYMVVIKGVYAYVTNDTFKFSKLKETVPTTKIVPDDIYLLILKHLEPLTHLKTPLRNYVFIRLLRDTGARLNEMLHITVDNIDLSRHAIYLEVTKNHEARYVFFTDATADALKRYIKSCEIKGYLFQNMQTRDQMTKSAVQNMMAKLKQTLGIKEKITPHTWRHTFATTYMRSSGNTEMLRIFLGHKSHKTIQRYIHYDKEDMLRAYQAYAKDSKYASNHPSNTR